MIPVLHGVWASGGLAGDFEHIETQTIGAGGAASITFSSIPGTYKHLQIRYIARNNAASSGFNSVNLRFNSDTTSSYRSHYLEGDGSAASSGVRAQETQLTLAGLATQNNVTASVFAGNIIDILDYASTTKNKTTRTLGGGDVNGSGYIGLYSGLWMNTAAVTSITLYSGANNLVQYSSFSLYGVK